jgi:hypothetical protein
MFVVDPYQTTDELRLKTVCDEISTLMENMDCTTYAVQIFVHHFGKWCVKIETRKGEVIHAFHSELLTALKNLKTEIENHKSNK